MSAALCVIVGAGGHAKVVIESIRRAGRVEAHCLIDSNAKLWNKDLCGVPIIGGDDRLDALRGRGIARFAIGVGRIEARDHRRPLFEKMQAAGFEAVTVIDPTATVSELAKIAAGAQVLARAVINPGAEIGCNAVINTGAIVEHDCVVGEHAFVGPGVVLSGHASVGAGCFVGAGAILLPGVKVGDGTVVGAGAVVLESVAAGETVIGVPARRKGRRE
jgi:UDP-perosamine 4-acetyltransferase